MDIDETFEVTIGGVTYTATVDSIFDPLAPSDANLIIFQLSGGDGAYDGSTTQFAYNVGFPGETGDSKIAGGWITQDHGHNGNLSV